MLDDVLSRRAGDDTAPPAELTHAWRCIVGSGGTVGIRELAAEVGWSRRHLGERFAREYGVRPKDAARIVRFERSRGMLVDPRKPTLARIAAACGFADQSHMTREWVDLAGCPPSAWLASEELPFVQDSDGTAGAD